jgi:hypothetical protein
VNSGWRCEFYFNCPPMHYVATLKLHQVDCFLPRWADRRCKEAVLHCGCQTRRARHQMVRVGGCSVGNERCRAYHFTYLCTVLVYNAFHFICLLLTYGSSVSHTSLPPLVDSPLFHPTFSRRGFWCTLRPIPWNFSERERVFERRRVCNSFCLPIHMLSYSRLRVCYFESSIYVIQ